MRRLDVFSSVGTAKAAAVTVTSCCTLSRVGSVMSTVASRPASTRTLAAGYVGRPGAVTSSANSPARTSEILKTPPPSVVTHRLPVWRQSTTPAAGVPSPLVTTPEMEPTAVVSWAQVRRAPVMKQMAMKPVVSRNRGRVIAITPPVRRYGRVPVGTRCSRG